MAEVSLAGNLAADDQRRRSVANVLHLPSTASNARKYASNIAVA
jgi:hypothetical protein